MRAYVRSALVCLTGDIEFPWVVCFGVVVCYVLALTQDEGVSLIAIALESNAHLQVQVGSARTGNARNTRNGRSAVRVPDERER